MISSQISRVSNLGIVSIHLKYVDNRTNVPSEANAATVALVVTENPTGAHLVRSKDSPQFLAALSAIQSFSSGHEGKTYVLIHVLRNVRDVEIRIVLVRELLELGVEGLLVKVRHYYVCVKK